MASTSARSMGSPRPARRSTSASVSGSGRGGGQPGPGVAVEVDVGRRRCDGGPTRRVHDRRGVDGGRRAEPGEHGAHARVELGAGGRGRSDPARVGLQDLGHHRAVDLGPDAAGDRVGVAGQLAAVDGVLRPGHVLVERQTSALGGGVRGVAARDARGEHHGVLQRVRERPVAVRVRAAEQAVDAVVRVDRCQGLVEPGERLHHRRVDEGGLAAEVGVHPDGGAARLRGDAAHGEGRRTLGAEDLDGLGQDPVAQGQRGRRCGHITTLWP